MQCIQYYTGGTNLYYRLILKHSDTILGSQMPVLSREIQKI